MECRNGNTRDFQKNLFCILSCICLVSPIGSQEQRSSGGIDSPYLIPQTVFVGDRARLVIPLGLAFTDPEPIIVSKPGELPASKDLLIHRIELERRGENARLLIDFTAFAPGSLALPPLEIPSLGSAFFLPPGITIPIASILEGDSMVLSDPAIPLTIPGTTILIYSGISALFLVLLLRIGLKFWGREALKNWGIGFQRRRQISLMKRVLRGLRNNLSSGSSGDLKEGEILTCLSAEFRAFLSLFTGMPCQSMTPGEFTQVSPWISSEYALDGLGEPAAVLSGNFLCALFRHCDTLRFSGTRITRGALLDMLGDIQRFIDALAQVEKRGNPIRKNRSDRIISQKPAGDAA